MAKVTEVTPPERNYVGEFTEAELRTMRHALLLVRDLRNTYGENNIMRLLKGRISPAQQEAAAQLYVDISR